MKKQLKLTLAAAASALLLAGCSDFLKGPGLSNNPNVPTTASADQLWVGAQTAAMAQWENYPYMLYFLWVQQISGVNRQWQNYARFQAGTDLNAAEGAWNQTYGPGGLLDLRKVDSLLQGQGNPAMIGESQVLEALYVGTAADMYGSVPYSTALTPLPTFDTQAQVYAEVQATLNTAITNLNAGGSGPFADFFYAIDGCDNLCAYPKWIALANTLKARFFMHTAHTGSGNSYNALVLDSVIKYATIGISSDAGTMQTNHTSTPGEQNLFFNFLDSRAGDVSASALHIQEIKTAGANQLLPFFYIANAGCPAYCGSPPDVQGVSVAAFSVKATTPVEMVSFVENQMLLAEAQFLKLGGSNGSTTLNNYRATQGEASLGAISGAVLQTAILREKYIHDFFNPEVWDDYLRTCYPNVVMTPQMQSAGGSALPYVPARLPVGYTEQTANATNVPPTVNGQPMNGNNAANLNTPKTVDPTGAACLGQVNRPGT